MSMQSQIPEEVARKLMQSKTITTRIHFPFMTLLKEDTSTPMQRRWWRICNWFDQVWWEFRTLCWRRMIKRFVFWRRRFIIAVDQGRPGGDRSVQVIYDRQNRRIVELRTFESTPSAPSEFNRQVKKLLEENPPAPEE